MSRAGLEAFGAYQKAGQLFDVVVKDMETLKTNPLDGIIGILDEFDCEDEKKVRTEKSDEAPDPRHSDAMPLSENRLSLETTRLAYERTMMAWIRTATSLITFGFAVYKFFQIDQPSGAYGNRLVTPRGFGIVMISMGLFALLLATIEHMASMRVLRKELPSAPYSLSALIAGLISILGILALFAAVFRQ